MVFYYILVGCPWKINHIIHKRIVDERLRLGKKYSRPVYMDVGEGRWGNLLRWGNPPVHRLRWQIFDLDDTDKSRPSSIIVLSFYHQVCFFNECLRKAKQSAIFHARATARRRKAWFRFRMSRILFAVKHSWMTLRMSRPLFVGSYLQVTWWAFGQCKEEQFVLNDNSPRSIF